MASPTQENLSKLQEIAEDKEPGMLQSMGSQRVRHDLATEQQTTTKINSKELAIGILALFDFIYFLLLSFCCSYCYCSFKVISVSKHYPLMRIPRNKMLERLLSKKKINK